MLKEFVTRLLESRAKRLLAIHKPKIVAVVGSVGKTSTKLAIASVLGQKYKVLSHFGGYNTEIAVPMAIFNMQLPLRLRDPLSWFAVFGQMNKQLREPYPYEVLVLELGTDKPGDIKYFSRYLRPDIAVVTAVAPEHMAFFGDLGTVAMEELSIAQFSNLLLINRDDVSSEYAKLIPDGSQVDTYGTSGIAEYRYAIGDYKPGNGFAGEFISPELGSLKVNLKVVGEHNVRSAVAAGAVGVKMGLDAKQIIAGMEAVRPVAGRMNLLRGMKKSTIIDDSYNSSPVAAIAALQTLYLFPTNQRIAILGSMNELGAFSEQAHKQVADACDPVLLDYVITIGAEAKKYLAPIAANRGCRVVTFDSPYDAGTYAHKVLQTGAVILVKGSQNGVFSEEAIKELLHSPEDEERLVRQGPEWTEIKESQFGKFK